MRVISCLPLLSMPTLRCTLCLSCASATLQNTHSNSNPGEGCSCHSNALDDLASESSEPPLVPLEGLDSASLRAACALPGSSANTLASRGVVYLQMQHKPVSLAAGAQSAALSTFAHCMEPEQLACGMVTSWYCTQAADSIRSR